MSTGNGKAPARFQGRLVLGEHAYRHYCLNSEPGITRQDLLKPEMWARNTDGQLRPRDRVRVIADDGSYDAELVVVAIAPGAGVIMRLDLSGVPGTAEYERLRAI